MAAKIRFLFGMAARAVAFALSGGAQPVPPQAIHRVSPRPEGLGGAAPPPCCPLRCFLTWRIDYFRAPALSLANTRKSETSDVQAYPSDSPPHGRLKMVFSPLYGTFRPHFSSEKWPWIEISIPWIGESMGWKWISMGCFSRNTPCGRISNARSRTSLGVRFNGLPYSAHGWRACALGQGWGERCARGDGAVRLFFRNFALSMSRRDGPAAFFRGPPETINQHERRNTRHAAGPTRGGEAAG